MFNTCQLATLLAERDVPFDTRAVIGSQAEHPLLIDILIVIGGMAYGLAVSKKVKVALAKGSSRVGTATNTGMGAFSEKGRATARKLILQYNRRH